METIKFHKPIKINGKAVKSFDYDPDSLTCEQYLEAGRMAVRSGDINLVEGDYTYHFYLGAYIIMASNPEVALEDLERATGFDLLSISDVGRNFILTARADVEEESSEEPSDSTPGATTQAKQTSEKKE